MSVHFVTEMSLTDSYFRVKRKLTFVLLICHTFIHLQVQPCNIIFDLLCLSSAWTSFFLLQGQLFPPTWGQMKDLSHRHLHQSSGQPGRRINVENLSSYIVLIVVRKSIREYSWCLSPPYFCSKRSFHFFLFSVTCMCKNINFCRCLTKNHRVYRKEIG